jgi:hypothetical protein
LEKAAMLRIVRRDIVSRIPILSQIKVSLTQNWNKKPTVLDLRGFTTHLSKDGPSDEGPPFLSVPR